jgi:hypothetical protein
MIRTAVVAMLLSLAAVPALAQSGNMVDATRPQTLLTIARGYGTAELRKDNDGDPLISGTISGRKYFILFYGCTRNENCRQIEFRGVLRPPRGFRDRLLNDWNLKYRYGKAYKDKDGDLIVNYLVHMGGSGVTRSNVETSFEWFKQMLNEFHKFMA